LVWLEPRSSQTTPSISKDRTSRNLIKEQGTDATSKSCALNRRGKQFRY
jgi:hypothetical protein